MHAFPDLSKKTSINSLLNPQDPAHLGGLTQAPMVQNHAQSHGHSPYYGPGYESNSYNLRTASWDDPNQRKVVVGLPIHDHRTYQETANAYAEHHHPSNSYAYQLPRMVRPRLDERLAYGGEGVVWSTPTQQRHDSPNMPYGAPVTAQIYSDERTGK